MRRALLLVCAVALLAVPAASADPPQSGVTHVHVAPGTSPVDWGEQLFGANCVTCHGPNGGGITAPVHGAGDEEGLGPSLRGVGARAADFYLRTGYMPLDDVHKEPHRSRVLFSKGELAALVAYVASLGGGPLVPHPHPERGNLADGQQLFTEHCAGCHQIDAQGGYVTNAVAPALDQASPVEIAEAVRTGPYLMPRFSGKQISAAELDSIVRYVLYAKHPDDRGGWALGHVGPVPEGLVAWFVGIVLLIATCTVIGKRIES
jgi:ubiquinol-cytochrome c reductase cytochrome c subunit